MADIGKLEYIAAQLHSKSGSFSSAAETLRQQATQLDWATQDLTNGTSSWAGQGSQAFQNAWNHFHRDTHNAANALDNTAQALTRLAQKIDEKVQAIRDAQAQATLGFLATGGLFVLDIVQLGLDPVTDAATVGALGADAAIGTEIATAEAAIVSADAEIGAELDGIANEIENSSELGSLEENPGTPPEDINVPPEENGPGGSGNGRDGNGGNNGPGTPGTGGEDPNELINELKKSGVNFTEEDIVQITRTPSGKIVWLEKGSEEAGLEHIISGHAADFAKIGVNGEENVASLIIDTLKNETPIGTSGGGQIFDVLINGVVRRILIVVGKNGFIVTAYPFTP